MVTTGSIWGGTFRFVRGNVGPIVIWGVIVLLVSLLSTLVMGSFYQDRLTAMQSGAVPSAHLGMIFLPAVIWLVVFTMLWAAVFRAVLFPEERRFAYLRIGMDELRLLGTVLILFVGGYIGLLVDRI